MRLQTCGLLAAPCALPFAGRGSGKIDEFSYSLYHLHSALATMDTQYNGPDTIWFRKKEGLNGRKPSSPDSGFEEGKCVLRFGSNLNLFDLTFGQGYAWHGNGQNAVLEAGLDATLIHILGK